MIDWWGPVVHEFYAATEGGGTSLRAAEWLQHPGSVGRAYPVARLAVLDDQGEALPAGEIGMIYLDDGIGFEYYKDPSKTAAARKHGMFTAGDYGYLDAEGWLYICDRRVDLIISGGVNIYPAEIEAVLLGN
jgi:long-chain acyl-CoA synthetase